MSCLSWRAITTQAIWQRIGIAQNLNPMILYDISNRVTKARLDTRVTDARDKNIRLTDARDKIDYWRYGCAR